MDNNAHYIITEDTDDGQQLMIELKKEHFDDDDEEQIVDSNVQTEKTTEPESTSTTETTTNNPKNSVSWIDFCLPLFVILLLLLYNITNSRQQKRKQWQRQPHLLEWPPEVEELLKRQHQAEIIMIVIENRETKQNKTKKLLFDRYIDCCYR